jgi:hypothetical protein
MLDLNAWLRRTELAAALTAKGYPTTANTLATQATRGGGPPYRKFGHYVQYNWGAALEWAQQRATPALCTTAEHRVAAAAPQSALQKGA